MPQMGESIAEGTISTWLKKVGDKIAKDEPLFEISTDKVDAEIPSPAAGVLTEIKVQPGETVPIDTIVAVISAEGAAAAAAPAKAAASKPGDTKPQAASGSPAMQSAQRGQAPDVPAQAAPAAASAGSERPHKSSPVVRKIAAEHQVDVGQISGTGIGGRVTKQDIVGYIDHGSSAGAKTTPAPAGVAPSLAHNQVLGGSSQAGFGDIPEAYRPRAMEHDKVEELAGMRQKIAEHMVISKRISPHVATVFEIDFSHVAKLRSKHKAGWQQRYGVNLTYTTFIIKATVDALKAFAIVNASTDGKKVIYHQSVNLGLAVALDWGLIVPVIHGADELNMLGLARRAADLANRARIKKLKPDEVSGGTFTITNPGNFGAMFNIPVINQPQVGILGVGTVEKRPVVIDDMLGIRTRAYLSFSFDHRLIDGAVADQFMSKVKKGIEEFDEAAL
ncbi:hypothetical protein Q3G72_001483 [Acer saccharum]|nr:hypothetical protein Q3G72_001483 [Acer saccharum]